MTLTINLPPGTEEALLARAQAAGMTLDAYVLRRLVDDHATTDSPAAMETDPLIALMDAWIAEDATDDPQEIAQREAEWEEFETNLSAHPVSLPVPDVSDHD